MGKYFYINGGIRYRVGNTTTGKKLLERSSPYDLQEYHWAYRKQEKDGISEWIVVRNGKKKTAFIICEDILTEEEVEKAVAETLIKIDKEANIQQRIDRT